MPARLLALPLAVALAAIPSPAAPPEVAPPPRPVIDPLADWTPRPATGPAQPWEKATDKDWIDARFRAMDTGPFLNCTMRYPLGKGQETVYKATVVKLGDKGDAGAVFDRNTMRLSAAWTGGYLNHSDRRFGLLNTPTPKGEMVFAAPAGPGWADTDGKWDAKEKRCTVPLPKEWAKYRGMYVHGDRVVFSYTIGDAEVLESPIVRVIEGVPCVARRVEVGPATRRREMTTCTVVPKGQQKAFALMGGNKPQAKVDLSEDAVFAIDYVRRRAGHERIDSYFYGAPAGLELVFEIKPGKVSCALDVWAWQSTQKGYDAVVKSMQEKIPATSELAPLTKGGPKRWGEPIVTKLQRGKDDGPFAVDTLTIPYKNRFNALFFCTGLDFLKDGRVAVCTCHGDVWLVSVDEKAGTCSWQRFATGLYHPLGLKVVDSKVVVLERGQLTRLHDLNDDGEADFHECVNGDWHCGGGEHSYDTCLETDPHGNFYFFKTGDTHTPTGGSLMRVSRDGQKSEVFATGFRHPIGMGMSPTGILTGADQEGNWMPATRIDEYRRGGFYGDMRAHHRAEAPKTFDPPLCWLPREVDNSAGGQVWVPKGTFGALAGLPLHLSYGRCRPFVLLRQEYGRRGSQGEPMGGSPSQPGVQGGVAALDVCFLSGVCRGRFHPTDGNLYVCGLNGWQTAAQADGCLQRVRMTGKPLDTPVAMEVKGNTIRLTFSRKLDAKAVASADNYRAAWWNYRWSGEYGSKRWKVSDPKAEGQDDVPVRGAKLLPDGRTVEVTFDALQPVMQMQVGYNVKAADGAPVVGSVFLTIHSTK